MTIFTTIISFFIFIPRKFFFSRTNFKIKLYEHFQKCRLFRLFSVDEQENDMTNNNNLYIRDTLFLFYYFNFLTCSFFLLQLYFLFSDIRNTVDIENL